MAGLYDGIFQLRHCYYLGFPKETPKLKFRLRFYMRSVANRSQVVNTHALSYGIHDTYKHMAFCNGGRSEDAAAVSKVKYYVQYAQSTYKRRAHRLRWTNTKDVERFRKNRSANFMRDVLISEQIMSEVIENQTTSRLPRGLSKLSCSSK